MPSAPAPRTALSCPQCGGPLPRQASWRMVACPYCRAIVTRSDRVVQREPYRQALQRAQATGLPGDALALGGRRWRLLQPMTPVAGGLLWRAESAAPPAAQALVLLGRHGDECVAAEHRALSNLQESQAAGAAYYTQRLPIPQAYGHANWQGQSVDVLVFSRPGGWWGSLQQVLQHAPQGLADARHAVWLWRRVLDVLGWLHAQGWTHGDLQPAHWLVHPADHGVLLVGWHAARPGGDAARDLVQSAWAIRQALCPSADGAPPIRAGLPAPLAALLRAACEDASFCRQQGAAGLDAALRAAAREAFGPPQFVPFDPLRA